MVYNRRIGNGGNKRNIDFLNSNDKRKKMFVLTG